MKESGGQTYTVEACEMMTGMCKDEVKELSVYRVNVKDTRDLPLEDEREVTYTKLPQTQCMNSKDKLNFNDKACESAKLI